MPLIFTTRAGKQNQHGRLETAGALRNKNPVICMLGGLAFYLLYRWDMTEEPFPDLRQRSAWYDIRVIKGSNRTEAFSYNAQRDWVVKAFQYAGITSRKKTHIGRSSGAKTAELKGISEDQIRRAGRWNQEQMIGCYMNSLPRKFMRTMAGHLPQKGCFEIRRAIAPPDTLLSKIWPELDDWKGRFGLGPDQINDLAAMGLTNLLLYLREVILQDSVLLIREFPGSPVWNHPVFQHPAYSQWAQEISTLLVQEKGPSQPALLAQALPALTDYLQSIDTRNNTRITSLQADLRGRLQEIECQTRQLQTFLSNGLTFQLTPTITTAVTMAPGPALTSSQYVSACSSINNSRPMTPELEEEEPPQHCMCRAVKTVKNLWREWTAGLQGQPAIAALDRRWGSRWRAGRQSEVQWYSLRLEIIKEIRRIAQAQRISEEAAMFTLSIQQQRTGRSIDQLCKQLRASRKAQLASLKKKR